MSKKEWVALHNFYKTVTHPTKFECELMASALGRYWTAAKVQNWFQHERSRKHPSKYNSSIIEEKDNQIWNDFCSSYAFEPDMLLLQQIQSAKQRCAAFLAGSDTKKFLISIDYAVGGKSVELMNLLQAVYEDKHTPDYNSKQEAAVISQLFDCNITDLPIHVPVKELRKRKSFLFATLANLTQRLK